MAPLAGPDRPFGEEEAFCELEDLRVRRHDRVDRGVVADHLHVYLVRGHGDRSGNGRPVELEPREAHPDVVRGGVREGSVDAEDRELDLLPRPRVARHHQSVGSVPALHHRAPALAEGAADLAVDPHLGVIVERCLEHDRRPRRVEAPDLVGHGQRGPVPVEAQTPGGPSLGQGNGVDDLPAGVVEIGGSRVGGEVVGAIGPSGRLTIGAGGLEIDLDELRVTVPPLALQEPHALRCGEVHAGLRGARWHGRRAGPHFGPGGSAGRKAQADEERDPTHRLRQPRVHQRTLTT